MCRPSNGPANHCAQPPLRPGTYSDGSPAAPAATRKIVISIPSSPSTPSARVTVRARDGARRERARRRSEPDCAAASSGARGRGLALCIELILTSRRQTGV
jgi:hypothetical protein